MPYVQVPGAVARVRESTADTTTKLAFEFLALTASRSGEVRAAEWGEIDWEAAAWEVPAARMKARRPYRVPLSGRAMEILGQALSFADGQTWYSPPPAEARGRLP
ncbi:MAG: tyrosine-type recombinase/integrase [Dehalococcoidia bacterium]|nr:tyrosine-type recombinase/integrase [Dehalococcoidia bacterium]